MIDRYAGSFYWAFKKYIFRKMYFSTKSRNNQAYFIRLFRYFNIEVSYFGGSWSQFEQFLHNVDQFIIK